MPVLCSFAAVYLLSMALATWLMKEKFEDDFSRTAYDAAEQIAENAADSADTEETAADRLYIAVARGLNGQSSRHHFLSAAVYDESGSLTARSCSLIVQKVYKDGTIYEKAFNLEDYLAEDELETLAGYWAETGVSYRWKAELSEEGTKLRAIVVTNTEDSVLDPEKQVEKTVWYWNNPDEDTSMGHTGFSGEIQSAELYFPGTDRMLSQNPFPEKIRSGYTEEGLTVYAEDQELFYKNSSQEIRLTDSRKEEQTYTLVVRSDPHPWRAAADYLKYVYLWSLIFAAGCGAVLTRLVKKTYRRRTLLEERRRDFTNAMAHEMKTPLSVIRAFAENLLENPEAAKREYYLRQMIGQTEEMDSLVKEMIRISRLDSGNLIRKKEQISVQKLTEELCEAAEAQAEKENIRITRSCEQDFILEGDREYLELAFRNVLSNAVSYNRPGGEIRIRIRTQECVIENTGENIPGEDLPHICEMFYTGNKSRSGPETADGRSGGEKHFGLGLYLAHRILQLHRLELQIENIPDGVRVTVRRGR